MSEPDPVHVAVLALRAHGHVTCAEALEEYAATSRAEVERLKAELEECAGHPKCRATLAEREAEIAKLQAENWRVLNEAELEFVRRAATARAEALEESAEHFRHSMPPNRFNWAPEEIADALRALVSDTKREK